MRHLGVILLLLIMANTISFAQDKDQIKVLDYEGFEPYLEKENDTLYVINFWATWCMPCIKELPYFEQLHTELKGTPFKQYLVSLDFSEKLATRVIPFIEKNEIQSEVMILDDPKANVWIDKVDPGWSGAIPATYLRLGEKTLFFEGEYSSYEDLQTFVNNFLKQ